MAATNQYLTLVIIGLSAVSLAQAAEQEQGHLPGPACAEGLSLGSQGQIMPAAMYASLSRARRQLPQLFPQQQQPPPNPLGFLTNLGPQVEQLQKGAQTFTSIFGGNTPTQAAAASQLQQAFQPQQQQPSALAFMSQLGSLTEMVRSSQEKGAKLAADGQQSVQKGTEQALQAGQQQVQQTQGGIQSALTEIGQGLSKIATNNPSLLPDIKNLYSSVSSKLSSASSSAASALPGSASSFPSSGPIVPAKNGDQLVDNLAKVAMGQTQ